MLYNIALTYEIYYNDIKFLSKTVVLLDSKLYKLVDSLDTLGVPSLKHVKRLVVNGPHRFTNGEPLEGCVEIG